MYFKDEYDLYRETLTSLLDYKDTKVIDKLLSNHKTGVIPINPPKVDERLLAQQSIFLLPTDISASFETNLSIYNEPINKPVKKILIPVSERITALSDLSLMNISNRTLFPGLDGFARSLKVFSDLSLSGPGRLH